MGGLIVSCYYYAQVYAHLYMHKYKIIKLIGYPPHYKGKKEEGTLYKKFSKEFGL